MDFAEEPTSVPSSRTGRRLAKAFQKAVHLKKATKTHSDDNAFCLFIPRDKSRYGGGSKDHPSSHGTFDKHLAHAAELRSRSVMDAFLAKLFAAISGFKAAYAELQMAQSPYNGEAIQSADQAVVEQLKALSELKYSFLKKQMDSSPPHVSLLLSEIQEQQSSTKMYEITMNKLRREIEKKEAQIDSLVEDLNKNVSNNKLIEKKINSGSCFPDLDNVKNLSDLVASDFVAVLHYALRSVRSFVKLLIREMQSANWDIETAAKAIASDSVFPKSSYCCFAFESFVCREMFQGFNDPNYCLPNEHEEPKPFYFDEFNSLKSANAVQLLKRNPYSTFGKFVRAKYLRLVHPKMEASFSGGNLNLRRKINGWDFSETTPFFASFAEMARHVWVLHRLARSFEQEVSVFQVRKGRRFSEVYMEGVMDVVFSGDNVRVAFTVVPGFKIGKMVVQSQVYLSPGWQ